MSVYSTTLWMTEFISTRPKRWYPEESRNNLIEVVLKNSFLFYYMSRGCTNVSRERPYPEGVQCAIFTVWSDVQRSLSPTQNKGGLVGHRNSHYSGTTHVPDTTVNLIFEGLLETVKILHRPCGLTDLRVYYTESRIECPEDNYSHPTGIIVVILPKE